MFLYKNTMYNVRTYLVLLLSLLKSTIQSIFLIAHYELEREQKKNKIVIFQKKTIACIENSSNWLINFFPFLQDDEPQFVLSFLNDEHP